MYRQLLNSSTAYILFISAILLTLLMALSFLFVKFGFLIFIFIYGFIFFLLILIYELRMQSSQKESSLLVPFIIISIPVQAILIRTIPIMLAAQLSIFLVILFYLQIYSHQNRHEYFRKIKFLFFPTIAFAASIIFSYFMAGNLQRNHYVFLLYLAGSAAYAYLACIYCRDIKNIKKILWALIAVGVAQLPFLYAQSRGWTDWLPAEFKMFNSSTWGGSASSVAVLRYGGMFGDYELLAEYLDMAVLFCIGIFIITPSKQERFFAFLSLGLILIAGFYTGSRTFILGLGLGATVMIFLMITKLGINKMLMNFLIIVSILLLATIYLSTQKIFSGYIARFQNSQINLNNFDTRNIVWEKSFSLMKNLPFTGYGAWMKDIFISTPGGNYDSPHSIYFWMFLTAGYPGLFAILIMVITPFVWTFSVLSNKSASMYHTWAIVFISVWGFWVANEVIIEFTRYPFYMDIIFFLLGITASFYDLAFNKAIYSTEKSVLGN